MRKFLGVLASCACLAFTPTAGAVDGAGGLGAGAAGGVRSGDAAGAGAGAAAAAARVRIPGRGPSGYGRPVGANFGASSAGIRGGVGGSASGAAFGGRAAAGANARAELRRGGGGPDSGDAGGEPSQRLSAGSGGRSQDGLHPQHNHLMLQADLIFARRLAQIDRLRDVALASGNESLLLRADQLEQQARVQHEHRIAQVASFPGGPQGPREGQLLGPIGGEGQAAAGIENRTVANPQGSTAAAAQADATVARAQADATATLPTATLPTATVDAELSGSVGSPAPTAAAEEAPQP